MGQNTPKLLISDKKGKISAISRLEASGMKGGEFFLLSPAGLIKLPPGSQVFMLPNRRPVGYDTTCGNFVTVDGYFAVAAFVSPGFTISHNCAYVEGQGVGTLPLFSYAAIALYKGDYYVSAVRIDLERRHDPTRIDMEAVRKGIKNARKALPKNRIARHLETCALGYGCPGAQNFFLGKYEGPLPVSPACNARCDGCISQTNKAYPGSQPRITFTPAPEEVAETALFHMDNAHDPVVSFGQGCEGEPLLEERILRKSIALIRRKTTAGMINLNTNASRPSAIARLCDAGLDSIRVSLNSARGLYYSRYYKPRDYAFRDILSSIRMAKERDAFVSINYLTMPGFTDSKDEFLALRNFVQNNKIDMIQWRNLNFDPLDYFRRLRISADRSLMLGIREVIGALRDARPKLMMGYYNPSKGRIKRFHGS